MSMDLYGKTSNFHCNNHYYFQLLTLADQNGWEPMGTKFNVDFATSVQDIPQEKADRWANEWDGGYCSNDHQIVTSEDAAAIAAALESALDDIPDIDVMEPKTELRTLPNGTTYRTLRDGVTYTTYEFFSGAKDRLQEFIEFCRAGEYATG